MVGVEGMAVKDDLVTHSILLPSSYVLSAPTILSKPYSEWKTFSVKGIFCLGLYDCPSLLV